MIKQEITKLLERTEREKIISFVAEYAEEDKFFYEKLKKTLLTDNDDEDNENEGDGDDEEIPDIDYYKEIAENCFSFGWRRGRGDYDFNEAAYEASEKLDKMLDDAVFCAKQGEYAEAAATAMGVVEIIPEKYEEVDDSNGVLVDSFDAAIELLCNIVKNARVSNALKKGIYDWCKEETNQPAYREYGFDKINILYAVCCEQNTNTEEVLADMDRKIEKALNRHRKGEAVVQKIRFMQSRNLDVQDLIQKHIELNDVRKIRFNQLLDDKAYDEALRLAERGIEIAKEQDQEGMVFDWQKAIFDIYLLQGDTANLLPMAEYLFLKAGYSSNKNEFYDVLKKYTPADHWPDTMERLLAVEEANGANSSFAGRILQEYQMWPRLFAYCQKSGIAAIERYEEDLKPYFEKEILEQYKNYAEQRALITNQNAYQEVARILKRMRTFAEGNQQVDQLLEKYRSTYKRRKNMMVALSQV